MEPPESVGAGMSVASSVVEVAGHAVYILHQFPCTNSTQTHFGWLLVQPRSQSPATSVYPELKLLPAHADTSFTVDAEALAMFAHCIGAEFTVATHNRNALSSLKKIQKKIRI